MLHWMAVENKSAATVFAFVFDGTDSGGVRIAGPIPVPKNDVASLDCRFGIPFTIGLFLAVSSSDGGFALSATDDAWWDVGWHQTVGG
jgi:hypothetical protein